MEEKRLTLLEHIGELRKRLIIIGISIIVCSIISYNFIPTIIDIIIKPAKGLEFIYLSPPELFMAYVKISLLVGFIIASPITFSQIWMFVKPGLKLKERKYVSLSFIMGIFFFALGVVFAYFVIVPITIRFFVQVQVEPVSPMFSFDNYIGFVLSLFLSFGLVFELPLLVSLLSLLGLIKASTLKHYRKIIILLIFIIAAILTPPDVLSQVLMAIPMVLLYEFGITIATYIEKRKKIKSEA